MRRLKSSPVSTVAVAGVLFLFAYLPRLSLLSQVHCHRVKNSYQPNLPQIMSITERTYIMVKPDGVQRALIGNIIARFEARGFKLTAMKMVHATTEHLEKRWFKGRSNEYFISLLRQTTKISRESLSSQGSSSTWPPAQ
jgi:hypothetical protein